MYSHSPRAPVNAYLGLGGNVGDMRANIARAIEALRALGTARAVSSLYATEPVGFAAQPWFLNCALVLETELFPETLLAEAKRIEHELGRLPAARNGPRNIDIDILLYGDVVMATPALTIPHPRLSERAFALLPLSEIAPEALHPVLKKTIGELARTLRDSHAVRKAIG